MNWTRISLFYLAGYLIPAGLFLIFVPDLALRLLLSNGSYGDIFPRLTGVLLLALGMLIAQIIRLRLEKLYTTTLAVRAVISVGLVGLYLHSGDPFFLVILGVVMLGVCLTSWGYLTDRKTGGPGRSHPTA
jgi:hypothetical protein